MKPSSNRSASRWSNRSHDHAGARARKADRRRVLTNLFALHSDDVLIDSSRMSAPPAMSAAQQSALIGGDEILSGSPSFFRFEAAVKNLFPFKARAATIRARGGAFCSRCLVERSERCPQQHFDTTRATSRPRARRRSISSSTKARSDNLHPFKAILDLAKLERFSRSMARRCLRMTTVTNNAVAASR